MPKRKSSGRKRPLTGYQRCMKRELSGGKMKGKSKSQRASIFRSAAKRCKGK